MQAGLELEVFMPQLLYPKITGMPHHIPQEFTLFGEERAAIKSPKEQHTVSVKSAIEAMGT